MHVQHAVTALKSNKKIQPKFGSCHACTAVAPMTSCIFNYAAWALLVEKDLILSTALLYLDRSMANLLNIDLVMSSAESYLQSWHRCLIMFYSQRENVALTPFSFPKVELW